MYNEKYETVLQISRFSFIILHKSRHYKRMYLKITVTINAIKKLDVLSCEGQLLFFDSKNTWEANGMLKIAYRDAKIRRV